MNGNERWLDSKPKNAVSPQGHGLPWGAWFQAPCLRAAPSLPAQQLRDRAAAGPEGGSRLDIRGGAISWGPVLQATPGLDGTGRHSELLLVKYCFSS